jgi:succinate dehydrogenase/fumarate reductase flavoprotein subunit
MWKYVSLRRDAEGLIEDKRQVNDLRHSTAATQEEEKLLSGWLEAENMLTVAELVIEAALQRCESRGSHWRSDFPETNEALAGYHYVFQTTQQQDGGVVHSSEIHKRMVPPGALPGAPSKEMAYHA